MRKITEGLLCVVSILLCIASILGLFVIGCKKEKKIASEKSTGVRERNTSFVFTNHFPLPDFNDDKP